MSVILEGADEFLSRVNALVSNVESSLTPAITSFAQDLLDNDVLPLVPAGKTDDLRNSGRVIPVEVDESDDMWIAIDFTAPGAFEVHEDVLARHDAPTQAKFLEQPFLASEPDFVEAMTGVLHDAVGAF